MMPIPSSSAAYPRRHRTAPRTNGTDPASQPSPAGAYPRLARLLAYDALDLAVEVFQTLAAEPAASPVAADLELAAGLLAGIGRGALPPQVDSILPEVPVSLTRPLQVPEGLRPILGELAYFALETRRFAEAARLFAALGTLAPAEATGGIGLAAVHLAAGDPVRAEKAARHAIAADPTESAAQAILAEALLMAGRPEAARRLLARPQTASGATAGWLRLLRVGLSRGWLDFSEEPK